MKALATCLLGCLLFVAAEAYAIQRINLGACKGLDVDAFNKAAHAAFGKRKYSIEKDEGHSVIGAQKKFKVEMIMTNPDEIEIRWVPGFGAKKDNWLINLKKDMLFNLF